MGVFKRSATWYTRIEKDGRTVIETTGTESKRLALTIFAKRKAEAVFLAQENARRTLESGVTAVRDLGASNYTDVALRDSINKAGWIGPRMFVAGSGLQRQAEGRQRILGRSEARATVREGDHGHCHASCHASQSSAQM